MEKISDKNPINNGGFGSYLRAMSGEGSDTGSLMGFDIIHPREGTCKCAGTGNGYDIHFPVDVINMRRVPNIFQWEDPCLKD